MAKLYEKPIKKQSVSTEEPPKKEKPKDVEVKDTVKVVKDPEYDQQEFLGGAFSTRPSAPVYDTTAEEQDMAMAKTRQFGNLLSLLGDVAGVGVGATVNKRSFKSTEPYMASIQKRRDSFEKEKKIFDRQEFEDRLREGIRQEGQKRYDEGMEIKAEEKEYKRAKDNAEWQHKLDAEKERNSRWWAEWKNSSDNKKEKLKIEHQKIIDKRITESKKSGDKNKYVEVRIDGVDEGLSEGEYRMYLKEALKDNGASDKDVNLWGEEEKLNSLESKKKVADYLMDKTKGNKHFKDFFKQRGSKGGYKTYKDYSEKFKDPSSKGTTPSFFK